MDLSTNGAAVVQASSISPPRSPTNTLSATPVICVFCGAYPGTSEIHMAAAKSLGEALHAHGTKLIYGGGTTGLMGEVARTLVSLSGPEAVQGIIPNALIQYEQQGRPGTRDVAQAADGTTIVDPKIYGRTIVVPDMHTRKQLMTKKVMEGGPGSGFVALSGGYGTLEELAEIITWNQLGIHGKGVVVFNVEGYYDGLIQWVKTSVTAGFIAPGNAGILVEALDAEECVSALKDYRVSEHRLKLDWSQK